MTNCAIRQKEIQSLLTGAMDDLARSEATNGRLLVVQEGVMCESEARSEEMDISDRQYDVAWLQPSFAPCPLAFAVAYLPKLYFLDS